MEEICLNCSWYESFSGVCCNGDSVHRADFTDYESSCSKWEPRRVPDDEFTSDM